MENLNTIEQIMEIVRENLELSVNLCYEYGYKGTADILQRALLSLADAQLTKEYEQSQRLELRQIDERLKEQNTVNDKPIDLTPEEADELMAKFGQPESEQSNGC